MSTPKISNRQFVLIYVPLSLTIAFQAYHSCQSEKSSQRMKDQEVMALVADLVKKADEAAAIGTQNEEQFAQEFTNLKNAAGEVK